MNKSFGTVALRYGINALLVFCLTVGALFCPITGFSMPVDYGGVLVTAAFASLLCTGVYVALFLPKKFPWPVLLALVLIPLTYPLWKSTAKAVYAQFLYALEIMLNKYQAAYSFTYWLPERPAVSVVSLNLFFRVLAWGLSMLLGWVVERRRSFALALLFTAPFLLTSLIVLDTIPAQRYVLLLLGGLLVLLLVGRKDANSVRTSRLAVLIPCVAVLLLVLGMVCPQRPYNASDSLPERLDTMISELPAPIHDLLARTTGSSSGAGYDDNDDLDLTEQGSISYSGRVMLEVNSTATGTLYLRGNAASTYTGTGWNYDSVYPALNSSTLLSSALEASQVQSVQVQREHDTTDTLFTAYAYGGANSDASLSEDGHLTTGADSYTVYFYPDYQSFSTQNLSLPQATAEPAYRNYVYETYLQIPAETAAKLQSMAKQAGFDSTASRQQQVAWVQDYILHSGTYSLSVSRQYPSTDFVLYFLEHSKVGYCVHFATAATVMCRALGIPARYVSGYKAEVAEADRWTDVKDSDAHAWTEVYYDGAGWVPVEVTPGSASVVGTQNTAEPSAEPVPSASAQQSASPSPTTTAGVSPSPAASPSQLAPQKVSPSPQPQETHGPGVGGILLLCLLALLLAALVIAGKRAATLYLRRKKTMAANRNDAVLEIYSFLLRLIPYGLAPPPEWEALAMKARYSPYTISEEEYRELLLAVRKLAGETYRAQTAWTRFRMYWLCTLDRL